VVFVVTGAILYGFFVLLYSSLRRQIETKIEDRVSFASIRSSSLQVQVAVGLRFSRNRRWMDGLLPD
jgi:hypothetical protein